MSRILAPAMMSPSHCLDRYFMKKRDKANWASEGEYAMAAPDFDSIKHLNPYNVEYWEARELMPLLGYGKKWQNFVDVIHKAMVSCETTGNIVTDHFGI